MILGQYKPPATAGFWVIGGFDHHVPDGYQWRTVIAVQLAVCSSIHGRDYDVVAIFGFSGDRIAGYGLLFGYLNPGAEIGNGNGFEIGVKENARRRDRCDNFAAGEFAYGRIEGSINYKIDRMGCCVEEGLFSIAEIEFRNHDCLLLCGACAPPECLLVGVSGDFLYHIHREAMRTTWDDRVFPDKLGGMGDMPTYQADKGAAFGQDSSFGTGYTIHSTRGKPRREIGVHFRLLLAFRLHWPKWPVTLATGEI